MTENDITELFDYLRNTMAERDRLREVNRELVAALELAIRYIEHLQAIPFALHASRPVERARAALAKAKEITTTVIKAK